jgi:hypothetical protein
MVKPDVRSGNPLGVRFRSCKDSRTPSAYAFFSDSVTSAPSYYFTAERLPRTMSGFVSASSLDDSPSPGSIIVSDIRTRMEEARREAVALTNRIGQSHDHARGSIPTPTSSNSSTQTPAQPSTNPSGPIASAAAVRHDNDEMPVLRDISDTDFDISFSDVYEIPRSSVTSTLSHHGADERRILRSLDAELDLYRAEIERSSQRMRALLDYLRAQGEALQDVSPGDDLASGRTSLAQVIMDMRSVIEEGAARRQRVNSRISLLQQQLAPQTPQGRPRRRRTDGS